MTYGIKKKLALCVAACMIFVQTAILPVNAVEGCDVPAALSENGEMTDEELEQEEERQRKRLEVLEEQKVREEELAEAAAEVGGKAAKDFALDAPMPDFSFILDSLHGVEREQFDKVTGEETEASKEGRCWPLTDEETIQLAEYMYRAIKRRDNYVDLYTCFGYDHHIKLPSTTPDAKTCTSDKVIKGILNIVTLNSDIGIFISNESTSAGGKELTGVNLIYYDGPLFDGSHEHAYIEDFLDETYLKAYNHYHEKMDRLLIGLDENWSEAEKALFLYGSAITFLNYALSTGDPKAELSINRILEGAPTNCMGYTALYSMLLARVGIHSMAVREPKVPHRWLLVKIDGEWYHADMKYDDEYASYGGLATYQRFLRSNTDFIGITGKIDENYTEEKQSEYLEDWQLITGAPMLETTGNQYDDAYWVNPWVKDVSNKDVYKYNRTSRSAIVPYKDAWAVIRPSEESNYYKAELALFDFVKDENGNVTFEEIEVILEDVGNHMQDAPRALQSHFGTLYYTDIGSVYKVVETEDGYTKVEVAVLKAEEYENEIRYYGLAPKYETRNGVYGYHLYGYVGTNPMANALMDSIKFIAAQPVTEPTPTETTTTETTTVYTETTTATTTKATTKASTPKATTTKATTTKASTPKATTTKASTTKASTPKATTTKATTKASTPKATTTKATTAQTTTTMATTAPAVRVVLGDVNNDGTIAGVLDMTATVKYIMGEEMEEGFSIAAMDFTKDKVVNGFDLAVMKRFCKLSDAEKMQFLCSNYF